MVPTFIILCHCLKIVIALRTLPAPFSSQVPDICFPSPPPPVQVVKPFLWLLRTVTNHDKTNSSYDKLPQHVVTTCNRYVITNYDKSYYNLRQVLQFATTAITIHDRYYNSRQFTDISLWTTKNGASVWTINGNASKSLHFWTRKRLSLAVA